MPSYRPILIACMLGVSFARTSPGQYQTNADPPARVGRVSYLGGSVSLYPNGATDWAAASLNYPLTTDDALWSDTDGRAEVELGSSAIRIATETSLVFGELSDTVTQVRVDQGSIDVRLRYLNANEVYQIDTPAGAVWLADQGHYRIDVTPDGRRTTVTVRVGSAQVTVAGGDFPVGTGQSATLFGGDQTPIGGAPVAVDAWERWADDRDRSESAMASTQYVSRDMVGYQDLDAYGDWRVDPGYGAIWTPRNVPAGWAPYRFGHWESVQPWGWTWIDDAPWGFAPFHYGRWTYARGGWGWIPGEARVRPVYAPALVAFVGGSNFGASLSLGSAAVGWVPLGPGEPYLPAYRASPTYIRRINITNVNVTRIDINRLDVNQVRYANRDVPGAMTAVPRDAFEQSRPVARAALPMRPADIAAARPSAVPLAGGQPLGLPPRGSIPDRGRAQGRGATPAPHPPATVNAQPAAPPPPQKWEPRPRPGQDVQRPVTPQPPPPAPATTHPPVTPQPPPPAPATAHPPVAPAPPSPDPARARRPPPMTPPAPATANSPATSPPPRAPATPPNHGTPPNVGSRPTPGAPAADQAWLQQRKQLIDRQAQETTDLDHRQQAEMKSPPPGVSIIQLRKQQQDERRALADRQQRERDALDKPHRAPGAN